MRKVILITGGARGLGQVIVSYLASKGYVVYFTSRKPQGDQPHGVHFLSLDLQSEGDCENAVKEVWAREKALDVIINNAGTTLSGPTLGFSESDFKNILDTNVIGAFRLLKAAFAMPQKPKLVINITSLNGFFSYPNFGIYSASKFAAEALGLALRYELSATTQVVNLASGALIGKSTNKMTHRSAREKILLLKWLLPMASMEDVAKRIHKLIRSSSVPPRVLVGRDAHIIHWLQRLLPSWVFDQLIFKIWNKK